MGTLNQPLRVHIDRLWQQNRFGLTFFSLADDGGVYAAQPVTFQHFEQGAHHGEPSLHLRPEEAQGLMDELWRAGLRPAEGTGSAGSLAATERHLKDMQRIAFHLLGPDMKVVMP